MGCWESNVKSLFNKVFRLYKTEFRSAERTFYRLCKDVHENQNNKHLNTNHVLECVKVNLYNVSKWSEDPSTDEYMEIVRRKKSPKSLKALESILLVGRIAGNEVLDEIASSMGIVYYC